MKQHMRIDLKKNDTNAPEVPFFPEGYKDSRKEFLSRLGFVHAKLDSIPIAATGQELFIDFATFGDLDAPKHLVVIAGTHGVEARVGTAIQLEFAKLLQSNPIGFAITFIHCLNPWGMSNSRRTNSNNVDLNRNCIFDPDRREGAPAAYEVSRQLTMPDNSTRFVSFALKALMMVGKHGFTKIFRAVVGGQFHDAEGLYYGGAELQEELTILESWIRSNLQGKRHVALVDIHSGLGKFSSHSVLLDYSKSSEQYRRAVRVFGAKLVDAPDSPESLAFETRGALSNLISRNLQDTVVDQFVLEFGTLHPFRVLHALVEEALHHRTLPADRAAPAVEMLREAFCPAEPRWRRAVVNSGLQTIQDAVTFFRLSN
jgi:hypothetical protein